MITSTKNQKVKSLVTIIKKSKSRNENGLFIIEGIKMFEEAPKERIKSVFVSESFYKSYSDKNKLNELDLEILKDDVYEFISDTKTPQGVLCVLEQYNYSLADIINKKNPLIIIADDIKDPGNLGTIVRAAEGAGVTGIILSKESVDIYNPKTIRSTMGSIYRMPFVYANDLTKVIQRINSCGITTYAACLQNSNDYCENDYRTPTAFIIGNESHGVGIENLKITDKMLKIPMLGKVESLNAAVACTILLYEAARQRRN